ncbi:hypothetical protein [Streptomyces mirabilis]|uniref:hypothetical protein n=1 Tax=Streptomyces mirabilis TaxID=68239 RepID=UPI0036993261
MAQRKKSLLPWPRDVWYTEGHTSAAGLVQEIQAHLLQTHQDGQVQRYREFDPRSIRSDSGAWWGFDAGWCTEDGARIRARLTLSPDPTQAEELGATRETVSANRTIPLRMNWTVAAEADRPWQAEWPSPALAFFPARGDLGWDYDSLTGLLSMHRPTAFKRLPSQLGDLLEYLATSTWYTTVITHDQRPLDSMPPPGLSEMLPNSMVGRVLEIRTHGDQDRMFNELLAEYRVSLPWGGSVILPSIPRKSLWASADYSLKVPGGNFNRMLQKTALHVMQYAAFPSHYQDHARTAVDFMRDTWELPEIELEASHLREELDDARREIGALRGELRAASQLAEELTEKNRVAEAIAEEAQDTVLETMKAYREHPLEVREAEARAHAEEAFSSQEETMALAEDLTAEVAWLRRQLAQVPGRSYGEEAPERPKGPESWREMADLMGSLFSHVRLGDVWGPLEKLAGHKNEGTWLRRTWEVLEALEAYAEAKKEHGPDVLPHFHAYLDWPGATALVPRTMYCASEVTLERAGGDHRGRKTRLFHVEGLGEVFMGAHFRVGGVRPPAPRMHIYDDTAGPTGTIHVGYIGVHLPNAAGR